MKSRLALVAAAVLLVSCLAACSPAPPKSMSIDVTSTGKEVTLAAGGTLTVTLEEPGTRPMGGFAKDTWNNDARIGDVTVLQQVDYKTQPAATAGGKGASVWTLKTLKPGESMVTMEVISASISIPRVAFAVKVVVK